MPSEAAGSTDPAVEKGREVFRLLCTTCHTVDGHLAIRPLLVGRTPSAIEGTLAKLAVPVDVAGTAVGWDAPDLRLQTWRGRRMPPFVGTDEERRNLALYLASLVGTKDASAAEESVPKGQKIFEDNCIFCHGPEAPWPIEKAAAGKTEAELYERIGNLPDFNPAMPRFEGTDEERKELARYLAERVR